MVRTARPVGAAPVRDKRYTIPTLLVDVFDSMHETALWSQSQMIIKNYEGPLRQGENFTGAFTFEENGACGLFEAEVARLDANRKVIGIQFRWISKSGGDLMEKMAEQRDPNAPDQGPIMRVMVTHSTINWSLSGMLLDRFYDDFKSGQAFRGMIRLEKSQEPGIFSASAIRVDPERHALAMRFTELPPETFKLLETAIKKSAGSGS